jgi:hypothetical protein
LPPRAGALVGRGPRCPRSAASSCRPVVSRSESAVKPGQFVGSRQVTGSALPVVPGPALRSALRPGRARMRRASWEGVPGRAVRTMRRWLEPPRPFQMSQSRVRSPVSFPGGLPRSPDVSAWRMPVPWPGAAALSRGLNRLRQRGPVRRPWREKEVRPSGTGRGRIAGELPAAPAVRGPRAARELRSGRCR